VSAEIVLALDAMGGDHAPDMVLKGATIARERHSGLRFLLFGDSGRLGALLVQYPGLRDRAEVRHAEVAIAADERPSQALRRGRQSSMRLAIEAVRDGAASGVVSAGNTGALMAMSKVVLKMLPGIDRPAIAGFFPTMRGESVMLDLGANVECDADNLVQFAVMGAAFARTVLGIPRPTVGLLNVGEEELKGNDVVKEAARMLRRDDLPLEFFGFIEGNDIPMGTTDVVVTDGFTGNVALKTAEGTAKLFGAFVSAAFRRSMFSRLGMVLASGALQALKQRLDPRLHNGGVLLGLNGISVKSHGASDGAAFATAIGLAADLAMDDVGARITEDYHRFGGIAEPRQAVVS
jgi:glycerol-3-phosphate acyltransferase PlsX